MISVNSPFHHSLLSLSMLMTFSSLILYPPLVPAVNALLLERVQSFGLRVCSKEWSASSASLLHRFQLPSMSTRRLRLKLLLVFKFLNQYTYLPPDMFLPALVPLRSFRFFHPSNLFVPFSTSFDSFCCSAARHWNSLPSAAKEIRNLSTFKRVLHSVLKLHYVIIFFPLCLCSTSLWLLFEFIM